MFWKIEGAVDINNFSVFRGNLICNNGALGALNTGVTLDGRALTTTGALSTSAITAVMPSPCTPLTTGVSSLDAETSNETASIYPNPFSTSVCIRINDPAQENQTEVGIFNVLGSEVLRTTITKQLTVLETSMLPTGIYFYKVINNCQIIQSGKLISQR